jgi:hypothetical protein
MHYPNATRSARRQAGEASPLAAPPRTARAGWPDTASPGQDHLVSLRRLPREAAHNNAQIGQRQRVPSVRDHGILGARERPMQTHRLPVRGVRMHDESGTVLSRRRPRAGRAVFAQGAGDARFPTGWRTHPRLLAVPNETTSSAACQPLLCRDRTRWDKIPGVDRERFQ